MNVGDVREWTFPDILSLDDEGRYIVVIGVVRNSTKSGGAAIIMWSSGEIFEHSYEYIEQFTVPTR